MGALTPIITSPLFAQGVGLVTSEISRQSSRKQRNLGAEQLEATQKLQQRQATQDAAQDKAKINLDAVNSEKERKDALRRAVARQRASFGAQGIGSRGGSSQAVLLGLFEESDDEKSKREGLDALRFNALDQDLSQKSSINVLQRTQLEERNKLKTISAFNDTLSDVVGFAGRV